MARGRDPGREQRIAATAADRHDVLHLRTLVRLGLSPRTVQARVRAGRLKRVHRGVYVTRNGRLSSRGRYLAAVAACGEDAVLSHVSAARLWGLLDGDSGPIHVTVPVNHGGLRGPDGVHVHRTRRCDPRDFGTIDGVPVTSLARTLADLAVTESDARVARAVHEAEVLRLLDVPTVLATLARLPGRRGARLLRRLMVGDAPATSSQELVARFLAICAAYGLPEPTIGAHRDGGLSHLSECDAVFEHARVIVELDGAATHLTRKRFEDDRRRDAMFAARGYQTLRYTWRRLSAEQRAVADELRAVLALRAPGQAVA